MNISGEFLIIGNGTISKGLRKAFPTAKVFVRPDFDIRDSEYNMPHTEGGTAVICAAITGFSMCEAYPDWSRSVNVDSTDALAEHLADRGWRVIMLSSNAAINPDTEYGIQKAELEDLWVWGPILRLPKILHGQLPLIDNWIRLLRNNQPIAAHEYGIVQPLHLKAMAEAVATVAPQPNGIYSVSGPAVTWLTIARVLAQHLGADPENVIPEDATTPYVPMESFPMRYLGWTQPSLDEIITTVIHEWHTE